MEVSQAEGGTRSGLLWEVERILDELKNTSGNLPQVLLMENVPEVIGSNNVKQFNKWLQKLESLGYTNRDAILNSKDFGIPQNRRRCFMVSILSDVAYDFPFTIRLKYRLGDLLEKNVDEKYYLTKKKIKEISNWKAQQKPLDNMERNKDISPTLTARGAGEEHSGMILIDENLFEDNEVVDLDSSENFRRVRNNRESPTLVTHAKFGVVEIDKENTDKIIKVGNYGNGYFSKNVYDEQGISPTLTCGNHGLGTAIVERNLKETLCEKLIEEKRVEDGDVIRHSYSSNCLENGDKNMGRIENHEGLSPTLDTRCDCLGVVVDENNTKRYKNYITWKNKQGDFNTECNRASLEDDLALTIPTKSETKVAINENQRLRIRKLTPKTCCKLMGFTNEDYLAMRQIQQSDSQIWHECGDSIVVTVLMGIFGQMLFSEEEVVEKIETYVEKIKNDL